LQLTLTSINVGEDIGLEMHPDVDQFNVLKKVKELLEWEIIKINWILWKKSMMTM
jgi:hypothetical protein